MKAPSPLFGRASVRRFWDSHWGLAKARRWVVWGDENATAETKRVGFGNYIELSADIALLERLQSDDAGIKIAAQGYRDGAGWSVIPAAAWVGADWAPRGYESVLLHDAAVRAAFPRSNELVRELRLKRFEERQRRVQFWISFSEISKWYARKPGSVTPDESKRADALAALRKAITDGEFMSARRILYLPPKAAPNGTREPRQITKKILDVIERERGTAAIDQEVLPYCWLPRHLLRQWLSARGIKPKPEWRLDDRSTKVAAPGHHEIASQQVAAPETAPETAAAPQPQAPASAGVPEAKAVPAVANFAADVSVKPNATTPRRRRGNPGEVRQRIMAAMRKMSPDELRNMKQTEMESQFAGLGEKSGHPARSTCEVARRAVLQDQEQ